MILVTGGTGLVGSHLLLELLRKGERIRAIKRSTSDTGKVLKVFSYYVDNPDEYFSKIEWMDADIMDYQAISEAMQGVDYVYHCAAYVSLFPSDKKRILRENIVGTANMVNAAMESDVKKFAFVSSIAALGNSLNDENITEEMVWRSVRTNSAYSESKFKSEMEVWRAISEGLNAVIINPSVILGPGNWKHGSSSFFWRVWKGMPYYTLGMTGFVDVRDVVMVITNLMKSEVSGERFIVSSQNLSYKDILDMIAKSLGKKTPVRYASPYFTSILQKLDAVRSKLFFSSPKIPAEAIFSAHNTARYSSQKIRMAQGIEFIPVESSVNYFGNLFLMDMHAKS
jgi:nucleoside-diphosphate-sugar epimerase